MTRDWTQEYFGITENTPVSDTELDLRRKLEIAVKALEEVMKPENDCMLSQRYNSYIIREALSKIKEIK